MLHRYEHHLMQATGAFRDGPYREKLTAALEDADAAIGEAIAEENKSGLWAWGKRKLRATQTRERLRESAAALEALMVDMDKFTQLKSQVLLVVLLACPILGGLVLLYRLQQQGRREEVPPR